MIATKKHFLLTLLLLGCTLSGMAQKVKWLIKPTFATGITRIWAKEPSVLTGDLSRYTNYTLGSELGLAGQMHLQTEIRFWNRLGLTTGVGINHYQMRFKFGSQEELREWNRRVLKSPLEVPLLLSYYQPLSKKGYGLRLGAGITMAFYDFTLRGIGYNNGVNYLTMELTRTGKLLYSYQVELGFYLKLNKWSELQFGAHGMYGWNRNLNAAVKYYDLPENFQQGLSPIYQIEQAGIEPVWTESYLLTLDQLGFTLSYVVRLCEKE